MMQMIDPITQPHAVKLITSDEFPFEFLSTLAARESWRKEIYRPIYHLHKWWAKRLGSVFRGIILGCLLPEDTDLAQAFYQPHDFANLTIFDPFMGSGTTIGEAHKLGCIALGRDINPVACESVRVALGSLDRHQLQNAFTHLSASVGHRLRALYQSTDEQGRLGDVLYYFWVKQLSCPHCTAAVDLFSSYVIARDAYPDRKPVVQICCPQCGDIFPGLHSDEQVQCRSCRCNFNPQTGPVRGGEATCPVCTRSFSIREVVRGMSQPPNHRLYGKLLLTPEDKKYYLPATPEDLRAYDECSSLLQRELAQGTLHLPTTVLADGFNTRQAMNYHYRHWRDFFNDRQLLALGWLQQAIADLPDSSTRAAFLLLFSGLLEFNNLFASYKGEGTGAVRHMFSHHILKPERTPIEANCWGTPKSSGSLSNLFKTRLLRALDYRAAPFEVTSNGSGKAHFTSAPFSGHVNLSWPTHTHLDPRGIYLSCGSSDETGLPNGCIDFVVTDPPFFDNVHYSELADFFYAWQSLYPHGFLGDALTTRHEREVQDEHAEHFAAKLRAVFIECRRVLKDNGLLVFTYHHSRAEGWTSLLEAVVGAGFSIVNAHPVKAEMSVATPKAQAKEPIQLDIILVCKKKEQDIREPLEPAAALAEAVKKSSQKLARLTSIGLQLSQNDQRVIVISQFIAALGPMPSEQAAVAALLAQQKELIAVAECLPTAKNEEAQAQAVMDASQPEQMGFIFSL